MALESQVLVPTLQSTSSLLECNTGLILPIVLALVVHDKDPENLGVKARNEYSPALPLPLQITAEKNLRMGLVACNTSRSGAVEEEGDASPRLSSRACEPCLI